MRLEHRYRNECITLHKQLRKSYFSDGVAFAIDSRHLREIQERHPILFLEFGIPGGFVDLLRCLTDVVRFDYGYPIRLLTQDFAYRSSNFELRIGRLDLLRYGRAKVRFKDHSSAARYPPPPFTKLHALA